MRLLLKLIRTKNRIKYSQSSVESIFYESDIISKVEVNYEKEWSYNINITFN